MNFEIFVDITDYGDTVDGVSVHTNKITKCLEWNADMHQSFGGTLMHGWHPRPGNFFEKAPCDGPKLEQGWRNYFVWRAKVDVELNKVKGMTSRDKYNERQRIISEEKANKVFK